VGAIIVIILLPVTLLLLRRRRLRNLSRELLPSVHTILRLPEPAMTSWSQGPLRRLSTRIRYLHRMGQIKRSRRGEMSEPARADTASEHGQVKNRNETGREDLPVSARSVLPQPPSASLLQVAISDDSPGVIQSISRPIMAHLREAQPSELIPNPSPYQPAGVVNGSPHSTQTNQAPTLPVAAIEITDEDMELAGAIANLIRAVRRGGEKSFGSGTAPPAYGEDL
jgi:hypothetical protein